MTTRSNFFNEHILQDSAFKTWCQKKESRNADSIDLYTAVLDFESKFNSAAPTLCLLKLARHIHRKYVSRNTGTCRVIGDSTKMLMSRRVHEVLDGKAPYIELFEPIKQPLVQHLRSLHADFLTTTAPWEDTSSTSSSNKGASVWFNDDAAGRSSRHEIGLNTIAHESESDRFAFFNAVCSRLNLIRDTKCSPEDEQFEKKFEKVSAPYGTDGFAPPPQSIESHSVKASSQPRRFESIYKKKRQQAATSESSGFGSNGSDFWNFERYCKSNNGTLEKSARTLHGTNIGFPTLQRKKTGETGTITLELRYENNIPMVAKISSINSHTVTLRYFRHLFGVHYAENYRLFFKSTCEDGSAQYQWTLLLQDDEIVPVFQNRISAVCRMCPPPDENRLI